MEVKHISTKQFITEEFLTGAGFKKIENQNHIDLYKKDALSIMRFPLEQEWRLCLIEKSEGMTLHIFNEAVAETVEELKAMYSVINGGKIF